MMCNLLHVTFCPGPVYLYAIHILPQIYFYFLARTVEYHAFIAAGLFSSLLCSMLFSVIQIYDLSEGILRFCVRP